MIIFMQRHSVQALGWYGVVAILASYTLANMGVVSTTNVIYIVLNLTGAIAIAIEAASKRDRQPLVLNVIWAVVALIALVKVLLP